MANLITSYSLAGFVNYITWNTCFVGHMAPESVLICFYLHHLLVRTLFGCHHKYDIPRLPQSCFYCLDVLAWAFWGTWLQPLPLTLIVFPSDLEAKHNLRVLFSPHGISWPLILSSNFAPWGHYFEPPSGLSRHLSQTTNIRTRCPRPDTTPRCSTCAQIKIPGWVNVTSASSKKIQDLSTTNSGWIY